MRDFFNSKELYDYQSAACSSQEEDNEIDTFDSLIWNWKVWLSWP